MSQHRMEATDPDALLTELNAKSSGKYFTCTCPSCQQQEAYMYKDNLNLVFCNRQNECGETTRIVYTDEQATDTLKKNYEKKGNQKKWLSPTEKKELRILTNNMRYFIDELGSFDVEKGENYRGISRGVYQKHLLITPNQDFGARLLDTFPSLLYRYGRTEESRKRFEKRDVVIPFFDAEGKVDRLLLRSTAKDVTYTDDYPKEIHVVVQRQKEQAKNYQQTISKSQTSPILVTESILNALSIKEVDHDVEFIAATGTNHTRQMFDYIEKHAETFMERGAILAFDPDKAGREAQEKCEALLEKVGASYVAFPYPNKVEDLNDLLRKQPEAFRETWPIVTKQMEQKLVAEDARYIAPTVERIATFLQEEYERKDSIAEIVGDIEKELKAHQKISIAFEESVHDVQAYVDLENKQITQEIDLGHGHVEKNILVEAASYRELYQAAGELDFEDLVAVDRDKIYESSVYREIDPSNVAR